MFALRRLHTLSHPRIIMSQLSTSQKIGELISFVSNLSHSTSISAESKQSDDDERFYITTAINYTNGLPHIGHAYEAVTSDVIARYHRVYGRKVWFLTGTDEHGQKVANTAAKKGFEPKAFCDQNVAVFKKLNNLLQISNDRYIRTTDPDHYATAKKMFMTAYKNGDIYKGQYEGWYDERNENFLTETKAKETDYKDPETKVPYKKQSEPAYFFRMSKYHQRLLQHLKANPKSIEPDRSYQYIMKRLTEDSLEDLCVSRSTFSWGIPVPLDDEEAKGHIIYVWFDALSNYLTGIGYFAENKSECHKEFWSANVHVIGKDIVWFHCVIWPTILMSCNIEVPQKVFCHGFVLDKKGVKMSKSLGNVVDPLEVLKETDSDSLRYFICTQAPFGNDLRWNHKDLQHRHDAHLTHIYGNLVNRALVLCSKMCGGKVPVEESMEDIYTVFDVDKLAEDTEGAYAAYDLAGAAKLAMDSLRICNEWITKKAPWLLPKDKVSEKRQCIRTILECIYVMAHFMEPFCPKSSQQVFSDLNHSRSSIKVLRNKKLCNLQSGKKVTVGSVLFVQHSQKHVRKQLNAVKPVIARMAFTVGEIKEISVHPTNERLYVESIDIGEAKPRQVVSGLVAHYPDPQELVGRKIVLCSNLKFSKFKGVESQGMVMCATDSESKTVRVLEPNEECKAGETLIWENSGDYEPDESVNIGKKKSFWKKDIVEKLKTDSDGNMAFDGKAFTTQSGKEIKSPFANAQIS